MGKNKYKGRKGAAPAASPLYPSRYGSHKSMVEESHPGDLVICRDERGRYITKKFRLDNGLADPSRWGPKEYRDLNDVAVKEYAMKQVS